MSERLWFTWEVQRRNRTTSDAVGARLVEIDINGPRLLRYLRCTARTLRVLASTRPGLVFAQNPSVVLAALMVIYGRLFRVPIVIDAHNTAVEQLRGSTWSRRLARGLFRHATLTIVSNDRLADHVRSTGGAAAVLPDPLPVFREPRAPSAMRGEFTVLFICTWALDEPYLEVIRAAEMVSPGTHIYITGRSKGREGEYGAPLPANVHLTGFVSEAEFVSLLHDADLIVDLTTREDCLVCGGYEAVAAGRPLLLSDTTALRDYFGGGALFTDNTATDIARRIDDARQQRAFLPDRVRGLKIHLDARWQGYLDGLERQLPTARASKPRTG